MDYIIAGDDEQARVCAEIKGLDQGEWKRLSSAESTNGVNFKGSKVYTFGTYRQRHMFEIREMLARIERHGVRIEHVVDGRLTSDPRRR